ACCLVDGSCLDAVDCETCASAGGVFQGGGSTCAATACIPTGACCYIDGSCADGKTQAQCEPEGIFQGPGSTCDGTECPPAAPGACCFLDKSCSELTPVDCSSQG